MVLPVFDWGDLEDDLRMTVQGPRAINQSRARFLQRLGLVAPRPRPRRVYVPPPDTPGWKRVLFGVNEAVQEMAAQASMPWVATDLGRQVHTQLHVTGEYGETYRRLSAQAIAGNAIIKLFWETFRGKGVVKYRQVEEFAKLHGIRYADGDIHKFAKLMYYLGFVTQVDYRHRHIEMETYGQQAIAGPRAVAIRPGRHFYNREAVISLLRGLGEWIVWIDRHFRADGLALVVDGVGPDAQQVVIWSGFEQIDAKTVRAFEAAKRELKERGVRLEWRVCTDETFLKTLHGRWLVGPRQTYNVPPVGSILQGQLDELVPTDGRPPVDLAKAPGLPLTEYWRRQQENG